MAVIVLRSGRVIGPHVCDWSKTWLLLVQTPLLEVYKQAAQVHSVRPPGDTPALLTFKARAELIT